MKNRPISVTVVAWLFIAAGAIGFLYHISEFKTSPPLRYDLVWVCLVRVLAILCGWQLLSGRDWARWLALAWLAFHVALSTRHSASQTITHALLLAAVAYFLFRPGATAYFRPRRI